MKSFNQSSKDSQLVFDLKVLTESQMVEKYGLQKGQFNELITRLQAGDPLPDIHPVEEEDSDVYLGPKVDIEIPVEPEKPAVVYQWDTPYGDNILVQRVDQEHSSNLVIPDSAKTKSQIGFVVAVGAGVKEVKQGSLVIFDAFASHGKETNLIDEQGVERQMLLLKEYDIQLPIKKVIRGENYEQA